MSAVASPTVHLNGTGKETLLGELDGAVTAVRAAIDAVRQMTVHGRDYYVQPDPDAYLRAREQHLARLRALEGVCEDLQHMQLAVFEQADLFARAGRA